MVAELEGLAACGPFAASDPTVEGPEVRRSPAALEMRTPNDEVRHAVFSFELLKRLRRRREIGVDERPHARPNTSDVPLVERLVCLAAQQHSPSRRVRDLIDGAGWPTSHDGIRRKLCDGLVDAPAFTQIHRQACRWRRVAREKIEQS